MSLLTWVGIALAGGTGAVARAVVTGRVGGPAGTLAVNLSGALVLGVLTGAGIGGDGLAIAATGFLGAYTTFSAWMLDADGMAAPVRARHLALGLATGLAAFALGRLIGGFA